MLVLEDEHNNHIIEHTQKEASLNTIRPSSADRKKQHAEIKLLENKLEIALNKYNDLKSFNKGLRKNIDVMRKQ